MKAEQDYTTLNYKVKDQKVISVTMWLPISNPAVQGYPGESAAHFRKVMQAIDQMTNANRAAVTELETLAGRKHEGGETVGGAPTQRINFWAKSTEVDGIVTALQTSPHVVQIKVSPAPTLRQATNGVMGILGYRRKGKNYVPRGL